MNKNQILERKMQEIEKYDDEKSKDKKKANYALDLPGVIDVLDVGEKLVYLTAESEVVETIEHRGRVCTPPPKSSCPYLFPDKDRVLNYKKGWNDRENQRLYEDLLTYHKGISELPDENLYDLLVLWDFHVWIIEKCHFSPFLYFYAVKERGKSRTVKGLVYLARRGIHTETVREADIIRWGNDHKAVLGFDAKNFPKKIVRANCDDLILARFERGVISSRTLWPERGAFRDTKNFKLFGPTLIATNRPVDDILESRTISIDMKPTDRLFKKPVVPEDALDLKARLAAFRATNFTKDFISADPPAFGRLGDITLPLYQIVRMFFPQKENVFMRLLKKIEKQKRDEATDTLEAQILEAVINLKEQVQGGKLPVEFITSMFNEGRRENLAVSKQTMGKVLKALGFDKRRMTGGKRGIYYDPALIKKLSLQYGLSDGSDESDGEKDGGKSNGGSIP